MLADVIVSQAASANMSRYYHTVSETENILRCQVKVN